MWEGGSLLPCLKVFFEGWNKFQCQWGEVRRVILGSGSICCLLGSVWGGCIEGDCLVCVQPVRSHRASCLKGPHTWFNILPFHLKLLNFWTEGPINDFQFALSLADHAASPMYWRWVYKDGLCQIVKSSVSQNWRKSGFILEAVGSHERYGGRGIEGKLERLVRPGRLAVHGLRLE